jgi:hypothetical protein
VKKQNKNFNNSKKVVRIDAKYYDYLKSSGARNNRGIGGQANWLFEIVWHLEETRNGVFMDIVNELTKPEKPLLAVKLRRR